MSALSRLNDTSSHGGLIISASPNSFCDGRPIARNGDILDCPSHGQQPITAITTRTRVNGRLVITVGATCPCGAVITSGSPTTNVE